MATQTPKIEPLSDRVMIRPIEQGEKTPGGLWIPEMAKDRPQQGEVVSVGPGRHTEYGALIPTKLRPGMTVLYGKYSGTEIEVDGRAVLVVKESDILAVVK